MIKIYQFADEPSAKNINNGKNVNQQKMNGF